MCTNMTVENTTINKWQDCSDDKAFLYFSYALFAIILLPTVFGNLLIIVSIAKFRHLRSNMHILIGNLAVSDLLIAVSIILQVIGNFQKHLPSNKYFCLGLSAIFVISLGTSSYNLLAMSIERFTAITFPLRHKAIFTRRATYIVIVTCWLYYAVFAAIPIMGWNNYNADLPICDTDLVWTKGYDILLFGGLLVVVICNGILCGFVIRIIVRTSELGRYSSSTSSINSQHLSSNFRRTKMTMIVFGVFALCWFPYLVISVILVFKDTHSIRCARQWCTCLGVINSALNWIIYGLANESFRQAFVAVLKRKTLVQIRGSVRRP